MSLAAKTDVTYNFLMIHSLTEYVQMHSNKMQSENLRFQIADLGKKIYFGQDESSYDIAGKSNKHSY